MEEKYIAAIDLGSAKFAVTVARISGEDIQIVYYKESPSDGIRNSFVFNPMKAREKLAVAISDAEKELNIKILQVCVGLPRYPVTQEIATGRFERTEPNSCITMEEIEMLKSMALDAYPLNDPKSDELYGAVAQSFSTDEYFQLVEQDVIGTISRELEGNFKVFIGKQHAVNTIEVVFNQLHIAIARMYFLPDAIAKAVLTQEEMSSGVALVDFGGGVTSVSIYHGNIMRYYGAIPFGGKVITSDIRTECSVSESLAENIKRGFGSCMPSKLQNLSEKTLQITYDDRPDIEMRVSYLAEIIGERTKEIVDAILYLIQESGFADRLQNGLVVTGGGALLMGLSYLIKERSGYNVKIGYPRHFFCAEGCSGIYEPSATAAMGMILAAKGDHLPDCVDMPDFVPDDFGMEIIQPGSETDAPQEEVAAVETPETVEAPVEAAPARQEPQWDPGFAEGEQGTLIQKEAFGEAQPRQKKRPPRPTREKPKREPSTINIVWKKWSGKITKKFNEIYDDVTQ